MIFNNYIYIYFLPFFKKQAANLIELGPNSFNYSITEVIVIPVSTISSIIIISLSLISSFIPDNDLTIPVVL